MPNEITVPPASSAERRAFVYGCATPPLLHARLGEPTQARREGILELRRYDGVDD